MINTPLVFDAEWYAGEMERAINNYKDWEPFELMKAVVNEVDRLEDQFPEFYQALEETTPEGHTNLTLYLIDYLLNK